MNDNFWNDLCLQLVCLLIGVKMSHVLYYLL